LLAPAGTDDRLVRRRVGIAWSLLVLNVLTFVPHASVLPIPSALGKAVTQASLPLALLVTLSVNRRALIRPNVFLCLVSLLAIEAIMTSFTAQYIRGTGYRTFRLTEFVATLWLLSPYWGRRDLLLVRCHLKAMSVVIASVIIGLLISPGHAIILGRLNGALWPIPDTQVAHYAAVTLGLVVVLWFCGHLSGRFTFIIVAVAGPTLLLTKTRTALAGMIVALLVAGLSLIVAEARVRRVFAAAGGIAAITVVAFSGPVRTYLTRGEDTEQLTSLTGRTKFWGPLLAFPRDKFQEIFGFGLSNGSFNGQPVDSNWLISYQEQGLFGVVVCALMVLFLFVAAYFQPRGVQRALALFLITYCLVASATEVGFTDASTYLLDMTLAASLLLPSTANTYDR
jgi:hypothetical protein